MTMHDELYRIGEKVDSLQMMNYQGEELPVLLDIVADLEKWFSQNEDLSDDVSKIVYNYTRANYMAIVIEIEQRHGNNVHNSKPYSQYKGSNDFLYDYEIQRLNLLREAITLYEHQAEPVISNAWMNQVRVNLANVYTEIGRIVEALEILESCKDVFGMARINYAAKLYQLAFCIIDKGVQKDLLLSSLYHYETTIAQYPQRQEQDPIPDDIFQSICAIQKDISHKLESEYEGICNLGSLPNEIESKSEMRFNEYKQWCKDKRLILSIRNLFSGESLCDDIHLPNMGLGYFAHDHTLSYYSWYNTLKQEYNQARYFLYLTESYSQDYEVHESQENILLINTLDYPAIGYQTELLKCSLKTAYGVLDKIGLLCNDFVRGKNMPAHKINFSNWFTGIETEIRINDKFTSLYWVAQDLSRGGSFKTYRLLRNVIEHRYLRVVDHASTTLEEELSNLDKMEYVVSFSKLQEQTYKTIKLIRALLFYVVFAFNACYLETTAMCKRDNKIFVPLLLSLYDDEWKN